MSSSAFRKLIASFAIVAVLCLGVVGALAVIPHVHGKDFNHSQHETCPVYQFNASHVHADVFCAGIVAVLFLFSFLTETKKSFSFFSSYFFAHLRAPPVLF